VEDHPVHVGDLPVTKFLGLHSASSATFDAGHWCRSDDQYGSRGLDPMCSYVFSDKVGFWENVPWYSHENESITILLRRRYCKGCWSHSVYLPEYTLGLHFPVSPKFEAAGLHLLVNG